MKAPEHAYAKVKRLNLLLGDAFGFSPVECGSQPRIAWCWSGDLTYPGKAGTRSEPEAEHQVRDENGERTGQMLYIPSRNAPKYEMFRQLEIGELGGHDRWLIAEWISPGTRKEWATFFGDQIAYPEMGWYGSNNMLWCRHGEIPTDETTHEVIGLIRKLAQMTPQQRAQLSLSNHEYIEKKKQDRISDWIDQHIQDHIPGKRGAHYLAFSESPASA